MFTSFVRATAMFVLTVFMFLGASLAALAEGKSAILAGAEIVRCDDPDQVIGAAFLREQPSKEGVKTVDVRIRVRGLTPGKHAVHIHETGECEPCSAAKGHFDPGPYGFTNPDGNHPYHSGDLINITGRGKRGVGHVSTETTRITLSDGPLSLFDSDGSAFIIHDNADTYCPDGETAGCAGGSRFACGVIERAER